MPPSLRPTDFKFAFPANPSSEPLQFNHPLPEIFLNAATSDASPAEAAKIERLFSSMIQSIAKQHEKTLMERCGASCITCKKAASTMVPMPTGLSNEVDNSSVQISVYPLCASETCKRRAHSKIVTEEFKDVITTLPAGGSDGLVPCHVCSSTTNTKRCSRCKAVGYCGIEHQKKDWKSHKKVCVLRQDQQDNPPEAQATPREATKSPPLTSSENEDEGVDMSITTSGLFNMAGPGEPPRYEEFSKEEVLAHLMRGE